MGDGHINILLIGESGVGKSTFINSFANYNTYDSLAAANKSRLLCLIPTAFTLTDDNYVDRIVHFGYDPNENIDVGKSSTQECKAYTFNVPDIPYPIRLIDTPGIGDARGVEQDEKNIRNIARHLKHYTHINAICFLLRPNVSILGEYFKYCIDHLLTTVKGAAGNLIFVFTHSRSTFYRPGETLTVLQELVKRQDVEIPLSKRNMFCLDNEAFRYGVALQHGFKFGEAELENFERSWGISTKSSRDILRYISEHLPTIELKPQGSQLPLKGTKKQEEFSENGFSQFYNQAPNSQAASSQPLPLINQPSSVGASSSPINNQQGTTVVDVSLIDAPINDSQYSYEERPVLNYFPPSSLLDASSSLSAVGQSSHVRQAPEIRPSTHQTLNPGVSHGFAGIRDHPVRIEPPSSNGGGRNLSRLNSDIEHGEREIRVINRRNDCCDYCVIL